MADFTRELEELIDDQVELGRGYMAEVVPAHSPRPMGTTKVKPEDAKWDYDNRREDYWPRLAQNELQRVVTEGGNLGNAIITLLKHDAEMSSTKETP